MRFLRDGYSFEGGGVMAPYSITYWYCSRCHDRHDTYDEARDCELGHIANKAIERTCQRISDSFVRPTPEARG